MPRTVLWLAAATAAAAANDPCASMDSPDTGEVIAGPADPTPAASEAFQQKLFSFRDECLASVAFNGTTTSGSHQGRQCFLDARRGAALAIF